MSGKDGASDIVSERHNTISIGRTGRRLSLTLKAFANFSPGLRFGNPGKARLLTEKRKPS